MILAVYLALIFVMHLPDRLVLFPSTAPINAHCAIRKTLPFEKGELELWTAKSQIAQRIGHADIYVLRFYGNADRAERWAAAEAEMFDGRAVEIWGMNYPGFGGSTGPARLARIGPAALVAFEALKAEAGQRPIVLFGASLGSTAALCIAAQRPVAGLILHNPPPLRQLVLRQFGWWNLWLLAGPVALQIPTDLDSLVNGKKVHVPAIFLLADEDEIVAPRFQKLVVDAYAGEKRVITLNGAHHNSAIEGAAVADLHNGLDWMLPRSSAR
jgi:hypothetical protein